MVLEDLTLNEVLCSECRRPVSSIPAWLAGAKVKFQCEECRQKHPRIPGMSDIEPRRTLAAVEDPPEAEEVVEETDEEEEEVGEDSEALL